MELNALRGFGHYNQSAVARCGKGEECWVGVWMRG